MTRATGPVLGGRDDLGEGPFRTDGRLVVSYPKSGRTWLAFALAAGGVNATFTHAGASTNRRDIGRPFAGVRPALRDMPLVFLHRHPIDTVVSLFHQVNKRDLRPGSARWFRMWLPLTLRGALPSNDIDRFVVDPLNGIEKLCQFNRAWLDHLAGRSDCLILTYEEMRKDPVAAFQSLLDFWGVTSTTGAHLAEVSTFDKMKAAEAGHDAVGRSRISKTPDADSVKVRKGKVRGYIDELRPETIAQCQAITARHGFRMEKP